MRLTNRLFHFLAGAALLGALLAPVMPAAATILVAAAEDVDVTFTGAAGPNGTGGTWRTGYARVASSVTATSGDPPGSLMVLPAFGNQSTVWVHAVENHQGSQGTTSSSEWITLYGSDGVRRIMVRGTGSNNQLKISKRNAAGTFTDLVTCTAGSYPIAGNANYKIDWYVNYAVSGHTSLYVAGALVCDYSGDTTTDSVTAVKQVDFASFNNGTPSWWSEMIVATTSTQDMNLVTCAPQANGTTQNWTGTASSVNTTAYTDTTSISTTSTGTIGNFTCPALPAGTFTVPAVVQSARIQGYPGTIANFRFSSRPAGAGSDFDTTADIPVSGTFTNYSNQIITTNPNTSGAWSTSVLGASSNFGIKSRP